MDGLGMRSRGSHSLGFLCWPSCLSWLRLSGVWPQGLLDANIATIPKADGDSTPTWSEAP